MKIEKLELLKAISNLEQNGKDFVKSTEEINKLKGELSRKDKSIANLRMANEELRTEKDLRTEGMRG